MKIPKKRLPRDSNQRAYEIARLSTEESEESEESESPPVPTSKEPPPERSPISEYLATIGRKGGLKGGKARAEKLTVKQRKEIATKAAFTRWNKQKESTPN